jgi:acyl-CoA thioesterase
MSKSGRWPVVAWAAGLGVCLAGCTGEVAVWLVDTSEPVDGEPDAWWRFAAEAVAATGGHASVEARLWGPAGELVAVSRQLVAEFSRP